MSFDTNQVNGSVKTCHKLATASSCVIDALASAGSKLQQVVETSLDEELLHLLDCEAPEVRSPALMMFKACSGVGAGLIELATAMTTGVQMPMTDLHHSILSEIADFRSKSLQMQQHHQSCLVGLTASIKRKDKAAQLLKAAIKQKDEGAKSPARRFMRRKTTEDEKIHELMALQATAIEDYSVHEEQTMQAHSMILEVNHSMAENFARVEGRLSATVYDSIAVCATAWGAVASKLQATAAEFQDEMISKVPSPQWTATRLDEKWPAPGTTPPSGMVPVDSNVSLDDIVDKQTLAEAGCGETMNTMPSIADSAHEGEEVSAGPKADEAVDDVPTAADPTPDEDGVPVTTELDQVVEDTPAAAGLSIEEQGESHVSDDAEPPSGEALERSRRQDAREIRLLEREEELKSREEELERREVAIRGEQRALAIERARLLGDVPADRQFSLSKGESFDDGPPTDGCCGSAVLPTSPPSATCQDEQTDVWELDWSDLPSHKSMADVATSSTTCAVDRFQTHERESESLSASAIPACATLPMDVEHDLLSTDGPPTDGLPTVEDAGRDGVNIDSPSDAAEHEPPELGGPGDSRESAAAGDSGLAAVSRGPASHVADSEALRQPKSAPSTLTAPGPEVGSLASDLNRCSSEEIIRFRRTECPEADDPGASLPHSSASSPLGDRAHSSSKWNLSGTRGNKSAHSSSRVDEEFMRKLQRQRERADGDDEIPDLPRRGFTKERMPGVHPDIAKALERRRARLEAEEKSSDRDSRPES